MSYDLIIVDWYNRLTIRKRLLGLPIGTMLINNMIVVFGIIIIIIIIIINTYAVTLIATGETFCKIVNYK